MMEIVVKPFEAEDERPGKAGQSHVPDDRTVVDDLDGQIAGTENDLEYLGAIRHGPEFR
jgi:hypothetical protein